MKLRLKRPDKGALLTALCLLALVPLALAPAAVLRLGDAARLDRPRAMDAAYAPHAATADDFYLLRQLKQRTAAIRDAYYGPEPVPGSDFYITPQQSRETMRQDFAMGTYALQLMQELAENGVLDRQWVDGVTAIVPPGSAEYASAFYYTTDSLGFVDIYCYDPRAADELLFTLRVESRTGQVVYLWVGAGSAAAPDPDPAAALPAWVRLNGLDALGDWAVPAGSVCESTSLYSAAGGAMASCLAYPTEGGRALCLCLAVQESAPLCLENAAVTDTPAAGIGTLAALPMTPVNAGSSDGAAWYEVGVTQSQDGSALLLRTPYDTMERAVCCAVPGCAHGGPACPAWLPDGRYVVPFKAGGEVYLLHRPDGGGDPWLERWRPDGRARLPDPPADIDWRLYDENALYGVCREPDGYTPAGFVRLDLETGALTDLPLPDPALLDADIVPWGSKVVLWLRTRPLPAGTGSGDLGSNYPAVYWAEAVMRSCAVVYDPAAGTTRLACTVPGSSCALLGVQGNDAYLRRFVSPSGREEARFALTCVDLAAGAEEWASDDVRAAYGISYYLDPVLPAGGTPWLLFDRWQDAGAAVRGPAAWRYAFADGVPGTVLNDLPVPPDMGSAYTLTPLTALPDGRVLVQYDDMRTANGEVVRALVDPARRDETPQWHTVEYRYY